MNVSLVYNNKKLIGRCSKFAIEKVQGTSPFVMLENFEPKQPQLNENQQIVLEWLKENKMDNLFLTTARLHRGFLSGGVSSQVKSACGALDLQQQAQVLQVFSQWVQEQEEE